MLKIRKNTLKQANYHNVNENKETYDNTYAAKWFISDKYKTGEMFKAENNKDEFDKGIILECFKHLVNETFASWLFVWKLVENEEELFNEIAANAYNYFKDNINDCWRHFCEETGYDWNLFEKLDSDFREIIDNIIEEYRETLENNKK